jgi:hypothetical protein
MAESISMENEIEIIALEERRLHKMLEERMIDLQTLRVTILKLKKEKQKWVPERLGNIHTKMINQRRV